MCASNHLDSTGLTLTPHRNVVPDVNHLRQDNRRGKAAATRSRECSGSCRVCPSSIICGLKANDWNTGRFPLKSSQAGLLVEFDLQASATDERAKQPGCFVATGSRDKTIRIWDGLTGQCVKILVSI